MLIESLGSGTRAWRKGMECKGKGHAGGVKLVCDVVDDDIMITGDTVRQLASKREKWGKSFESAKKGWREKRKGQERAVAAAVCSY